MYFIVNESHPEFLDASFIISRCIGYMEKRLLGCALCHLEPKINFKI